MQIVIDKDELIENMLVVVGSICNFDKNTMEEIANAVLDNTNITILPKGHGDLVDRNCICKAAYAAEDNLTGSDMTYDEMDFYNYGIDSMWDKLQNAEPIVLADKEE